MEDDIEVLLRNLLPQQIPAHHDSLYSGVSIPDLIEEESVARLDSVYRVNKIQTGVASIISSLHSGSVIGNDVSNRILVSEAMRFSEEDPYTDYFIDIGGFSIEALLSRFSVDLNRPPARCFYRYASDAWGMALWNSDSDFYTLAPEAYRRYRQFYAGMTSLFRELVGTHDYLLHLDIHSYGGHLPNEPDICVGTGTVQTAMRPIANRFITALCDASRVDSLPLKIEENFPFRGGTFTQWVNKFFGQTVCSIQIEFNKSILMSGDRLNITHAALLKTILDTAHQQTIASFNVY